ncbi:MAG: AAA family ATPase [Planctomycetota bacterium]
MSTRVVIVGDGLGPTDRDELHRQHGFRAFDLAEVEAMLAQPDPPRRLLALDDKIATSLRSHARSIAEVEAFGDWGSDVADLADLHAEPTAIRTIVGPWWPRCAVTLLAGEGGSGKSSLIAGILGPLTRGDEILGLGKPETPISALVVSLEDDPVSVTLPRMRHDGADLDRIRIVTGFGAGDTHESAPRLRVLRRLVEGHKPDLVVLDTAAMFAPDLDPNRPSQVGRLIALLAAIAAEADAAVLAAWHYSKRASGGLVDRVIGSQALTNGARQVLAIAPDPGGDDESGEFVIACRRSNAIATPQCWRYRLGSVPHPAPSECFETLGVVEGFGSDPRTVGQLQRELDELADATRAPSQLDEACRVGVATIARGRRTMTALREVAADQWIEASDSSLRRALDRLGCTHERAFGGVMFVAPGETRSQAEELTHRERSPLVGGG